MSADVQQISQLAWSARDAISAGDYAAGVSYYEGAINQLAK